MRTMKQLVQEALDVQNACNMSGIVRSYAEALSDLREILEKEGSGFSTEKLNRHPVSVMWACKIADLSGAMLTKEVSHAFKWADFYLNEVEKA